MKLIIGLGLLLTGCVSSPAKDTYIIEWQGSKDEELFASYAVSFPKTPEVTAKLEQVKATLPHKVTVTLPKDAMVAVSGTTFSKPVEIKIYRNGKQCGKPAIVGTNAMANKVCL